MPNTPPIASEFEHAIRVWQRAQVIHDGPAGRTEAWTVLERIVARPDDFHDLLVTSLTHPSQLVVGYSLLALDRMHSRALEDLPPQLLTRRDKITLRTGSFSQSMDLGGLARQITKRRRDRVA
jgi:hypothetical protein